MTIKIITDSTADLPKEIVDEYGIRIMPLMVNFGSNSYRDGFDLSSSDFYKKLINSKELPTTSQINPPSFITAYKKELQNDNSVISIHLSSKGSGTYQSAIMAREALGDDRITVIDSLGYSMGMGLLVIEAARLARDGVSASDIESRILEMRGRMQYIFGVDTLEYLKKGGRLSPAKAAIATVMNIKPILHIKDGEIEVLEKVRGRKKVLSKIVELAGQRGHRLEDQIMAITHAECPEDASYLRDMVMDRYNPKDVIISNIGCVIGTHTGPGAIALFCMGE
jgi:DegV family protein with EDD domain